MATVPGSPDPITTIHPAFRPTQADFLQAAAIMDQQGKFVTDERGQPVVETETVGDIARKWQGFESRFPKEQHNIPKEQMIIPQVRGKMGWT